MIPHINRQNDGQENAEIQALLAKIQDFGGNNQNNDEPFVMDEEDETEMKGREESTLPNSANNTINMKRMNPNQSVIYKS
jgi:hypothetical protein